MCPVPLWAGDGNRDLLCCSKATLLHQLLFFFPPRHRWHAKVILSWWHMVLPLGMPFESEPHRMWMFLFFKIHITVQGHRASSEREQALLSLSHRGLLAEFLLTLVLHRYEDLPHFLFRCTSWSWSWNCGCRFSWPAERAAFTGASSREKYRENLSDLNHS